MTLSDRDFGRLEGKVDGIETRIAGVEGRLSDMAATASAEHAEVRGDFKQLGDEIRTAFAVRDGRIDALERDRDRVSGAGGFAKGAAALVLALISFFLGGGKP